MTMPGDMRPSRLSTGRRAIFSSLDEISYSGSNVLMTVAVAASLEGRETGLVNLVLVATLGLGGVLRGALGESLAIQLAGGSDASVRHKETVVGVLLSLTPIALLACVALVIAGAPTWSIVLVIAFPPFAAQMLWRSLSAILGQSVVSLASSTAWLIAQASFFLVLVLTGNHSALLLCVGWLIGVLAAVGVAVGFSRPAEWREVRLQRSLSLVRVSSTPYALEGTLAFAGPQIVVAVAAIGLGIEAVADFRLVAVILGPIAVVGSGLRLAWVGDRNLAINPVRLTVWTALLIGPLSAIGAIVVLLALFSFADVFVASFSAALAISVGLLAFARAIGASSSLPIARLRSVAPPTTFLLARMATVVASVTGVFIGSLVAGLSAALVGVALAALASAGLYLALDQRHTSRTAGQSSAVASR